MSGLQILQYALSQVSRVLIPIYRPLQILQGDDRGCPNPCLVAGCRRSSGSPRPARCNRNIMQATCVVLLRLLLTLKKGKRNGEMNFNHIFHLTQHSKNIISACHQYKNYEIVYDLFWYSFWIPLCILHIPTSLFGLATVQALSSHMWLVVTVLISVVLDLHSKCGLDQQRQHHLGPVRRAEAWSLLPTCCIRTCILSWSPGVHPQNAWWSVRNAGLEDL